VTNPKIERALISVSDKTGLTEFAQDLARTLSPAVAWHEQYEDALPLGWQHDCGPQ